jgi:biopolymer transport protein ExbD
MKKRMRETLSADLTPLIDVVFLLLIFFMVSTVFKKDELALLLSLPQASEGGSAKSKQKTMQIELSENEIAYNGKKINFEELNTSLQSVKDKKSLFELRIDKSVKYERVVQLLDLMKKYSLSNLELVTSK